MPAYDGLRSHDQKETFPGRPEPEGEMFPGASFDMGVEETRKQPQRQAKEMEHEQ
jgi:hypothetical protein